MESLSLVLALVVLASGIYDPIKEANEYPYIVSIHTKAEQRNYICAGSLVASTWVLTTASCLKKLACRIRYGNMTLMQNATYSRILRRIHHRSSRSTYIKLDSKRLTPRTNNIGLALIEEAPNIQTAALSAIDYTALIGQQVTYFEYDFLPTLKSRIYNYNKDRIFGNRGTKYPKITSPKGMYIPASHDVIDVKLLRVGDGIAVKCHTGHPGPNICVANKCFDYSVSDPRVSRIIPDYGSPLVHDEKLVGVTSEVDRYISTYTPISLYLDWIREQIHCTPTR